MTGSKSARDEEPVGPLHERRATTSGATARAGRVRPQRLSLRQPARRSSAPAPPAARPRAGAPRHSEARPRSRSTARARRGTGRRRRLRTADRSETTVVCHQAIANRTRRADIRDGGQHLPEGPLGRVRNPKAECHRERRGEEPPETRRVRRLTGVDVERPPVVLDVGDQPGERAEHGERQHDPGVAPDLPLLPEEPRERGDRDRERPAGSATSPGRARARGAPRRAGFASRQDGGRAGE